MESMRGSELKETLGRQLEAAEQAISRHREAISAGDDISFEQMIELTRFVTRLEIAGVAKSW